MQADEESVERRRQRAERALAEWLGRGDNLEALDVESLCAEKPELADELRAAWRDLQHVDGLMLALAEHSPSKPKAATSGSAGASNSAADELVQRLLDSRPPRSRYDERGEVARGGMGAILEVWDGDLQRTLAMKVALGQTSSSSSAPQTPQDARRLGRFLDEARVTGQLEHPGIVPVHELGVDAEGRVYFTMPLLKGRDMRAVFKKARGEEEDWNRERALGVVQRVCETLAYAHDRGVIHRDLKPANVMVGAFGEAYVMDWGLARVQGREDLRDIRLKDAVGSAALKSLRRETAGDSPDLALVTNDGDVIGTPAYMPPEQARGEIDEVDQRADVYAIGAMIYELYAGQAPYQPQGGRRLGARAVLALLLEGPPRPLHEFAPDLPAELDAVVEKAMRRDKHERYANVEQLGKDLRAFLEHRVVHAYETGPLAEFRKWVGRNRGTAGALAALVALAIGASLFIAWRESESANELRTAYGDLEREQGVKLALSDFMTAQVLTEELNDFGPDEEGTDGMQRWIERTEEVLERGPLEERPFADGVAATLTQAEQAVHSERLEVLGGHLERQRERLEFNRGLRSLSLDQHAEDWTRCIASIADSSLYDGLMLRPQLGLVPLREDPESGLWEFWHVASGARPEFDPDYRGYSLVEDSGMVLILIPAGRFEMGSPFDELGHEGDETLHPEELAAFFIAKYELTQSQWMRTMGENPSFQPRGTDISDVPTTGLHPVEMISWIDASDYLRLVGLRLPTEAEWEYAARAGSDAAYAFGPEASELEGRENLADDSHMQFFWAPTAPTVAHAAEWDDGFPGTAPIGSFEPNPWGLHDVHGNLGEWTSSLYTGDYGELAPDVPPPEGEREERIGRGGNAVFGPSFARLASRQVIPPRNASRIIGLRAARELE